jgi:signal transduction histidine kinase
MQRAQKFRRRLTEVAILLIILLVCIFWFAFRSIERVDSLSGLVVHIQDVLHDVESFWLMRASLRNNYWAFIYTRDTKYRDTFRARRQELEQILAHLRSLTVDNPEQQKILDELAPILLLESDAFAARLDDPTPRDRRDYRSTVRPSDGLSLTVPASDRTRSLIDAFENHEALLFKTRSGAVQQSAHLTREVFIVAGILTLAILFIAGHTIQREIMKRATVEVGLRRAQEILGVRLEEQRSELGHAVEDLHAQIRARQSADEKLRKLNEELEIRVQARTAELQELNRELEAFTYSVSHDLRAPLRHMDGFSRILQEEFGARLPDEARHYLDRIRSAATNMAHLVEDLLHLSRVGRQLPRRQRTSLNTLVQEAKAEALAEAGGRQIRWKIQSLPDVDADPVLLRQVFTNLLSNAVKFSRKQDQAVIEIGARHDAGKLVIFVRDNGAGFDPRYADKLFGVFQRLHTQDEYEGTGIGLATVQRIIHKHGGNIWADSQPGAGATFSFTLPPVGRVPAPKDEIGVAV